MRCTPAAAFGVCVSCRSSRFAPRSGLIALTELASNVVRLAGRKDPAPNPKSVAIIEGGAVAVLSVGPPNRVIVPGVFYPLETGDQRFEFRAHERVVGDVDYLHLMVVVDCE